MSVHNTQRDAAWSALETEHPIIIEIITRYDLFDLKASLHKNFNPVSLPDAFCSLHYVHDIRMFDCNIEAGL